MTLEEMYKQSLVERYKAHKYTEGLEGKIKYKVEQSIISKYSKMPRWLNGHKYDFLDAVASIYSYSGEIEPEKIRITVWYLLDATGMKKNIRDSVDEIKMSFKGKGSRHVHWTNHKVPLSDSLNYEISISEIDRINLEIPDTKQPPPQPIEKLRWPINGLENPITGI